MRSRTAVWLLLLGATACLLLAALLFDDGAVLLPGNLARLVLATALLTVGGALAMLAVLEAWQPARHLTDRPQDLPPGRRDRRATPRAGASNATPNARW